MISKRGQAEQFNWIFIIVAGAIILGFFTMFAFKYMDLEEKKEDLQSIRDFGNVLNTLEKLPVGDAGTSIDSNRPDEGLRFGYKLKLKFSCLGEKSSIFVGDGSYANYDLEDGVVFTEDRQEVRALDLWLMPWRFPFHVTNIIYLSDPNRNYYLVYDESSKDFVEELEASRALNIEKVNIKNLGLKSNSRVMFFTRSKPSEERLNGLQEGLTGISFVYVDRNNNGVSFFEEEWKEPIKFYGNELMFGALFVSNSESYNCNIERALKRFSDATNVYIERARVLNQINQEQKCNYNNIANLLRDFSAGRYELKEEIEVKNKVGGCLWVF